MPADAPDTDGRRASLAWLPNALTMARVAIAPALLAYLLWVAAFPEPARDLTTPAAALLLLAAALDWLDGRLARALGAESAFGRFWDPVADKLVVGAALVGGSLALADASFVIPAAALILRDVLVTWLRTRPRHAAATAAPSQLAKWKTALEYAALIVLFSGGSLAGLIGRVAPHAYELTRLGLAALGTLALWVAAALSLWTGWTYWRRAHANKR